MEKFFIIHYSEIGLKGGNRNFFEDKLVFHIKRALTRENFDFVKKISGRLILKLSEKSDCVAISEKLKKVFGIAHFCEAFASSQDLEVLKKDAAELMKKEISRKARNIISSRLPLISIGVRSNNSQLFFERSALGGESRSITFKIETQRSNKDYPFTSQQVNEKVGEYVLENSVGVTELARSINEASFVTPNEASFVTPNEASFVTPSQQASSITQQAASLRAAAQQAVSLRVDLKNPDITCYIEIVEKYAFIYFQKIKGAGGMPTGTSGKIVSLISSGFDSPVASYFLMRRGAEIIFVHFESTPQTSSASIENVKNLVKKLTEYQLRSKLYLIPFLEIQKEIIKNCALDLAVILYRRMMVRIAQEIGKKENARALVTGDNLGQVASQTLENIEVINQVAQMPIFRPLIGFDKVEIINFARKISTYEISSQPYEDCCSLFIPRHPQTRARIEEVEKEEKKLDIQHMVDAVLKRAKIEEIKI